MADGDQGNYGEGDFSADGQYGDYNEGQFADGQYQQDGTGASGVNDGTQNGSAETKGNEDERKLFVGGISWDTENKDLREYFSKFGTVADVNIKTDPTTGKSRGFGFVTFTSKDALAAVLKESPHSVKGKQIDPKPAKARPGIKKIFVGGLEAEMPEADIKAYFEKFGPVESVELPFDKAKNQRRQFAFVTFEREDSVEMVCREPKQKIGNKECDIKKATPKPDPRSMRGGGGGWGGFPGGGRGAGGGRGGRGGRGGQGWGGGGYGGGQGGYGGYGQGGYGGYGQQSNFGGKTRRGGGGNGGGSGGYHPYNR
ncbi:RNA-binding protein squid-like isoform X4 [Ornithodoros turicata]|uniref:RNA-binding protein squid-like isoform X4 n=1 Tax=Ornithodoros turicata TaxID=34597 RepID=UPI003139346A